MQEVALFEHAEGALGGALVMLPGGVGLPGLLEQVGPDGVEAVVASQSGVGLGGVELFRAMTGPRTMARATMRFSVTIEP